MRRLIIDRLLTEKKLVSFEEFQQILQVSAPTVKRDLRYMREVLKAPIVFSKSRGGYLYADQSNSQHKDKDALFVVPKMQQQWYSASELYVLIKTIDLLTELSKDETSAIYSELEPLRSRVMTLLHLGGTSPKELLKLVKVIDRQPLHTEPDVFATVGVALCSQHRLQISYHSPARNSDSVREISPLRLVHYRNRWYVDAYCHASEAYRKFAIENISRAAVLNSTARRVSAREIENEFDQDYGVFRGGTQKTAELFFDATVAPYVRRQVWHEKQKMVKTDDGILLSVPYTDSTELIGEILRWGAHVRVQAPEELRQEVRTCLLETLNQYAE